jgi:cyclohexa-1,5-dienecarbonyl-CoA hydratase
MLRVRADDAVCRITMARPPLNIVTTEMLDELTAEVQAVAALPAVKVVLLTGEGGRAFCAGVDVADHTRDRVADMMAAFERALQALLGLDVPVIAALNGAALGGGLELALACDILIASDTAVLGVPEIRLGVFPPAAAVLLPRLVGRQHALDLILTGRTVSAAEAHSRGLVSAVMPAATFEQDAGAYAAMLASRSGPVLKLAKRAVAVGSDLPPAAALVEADRIYLQELMLLHDPHEGLAAFMEKRDPVWRDA